MIQEQDIVKENSETLNSSVMTEAYIKFRHVTYNEKDTTHIIKLTWNRTYVRKCKLRHHIC